MLDVGFKDPFDFLCRSMEKKCVLQFFGVREKLTVLRGWEVGFDFESVVLII